MATLSVMYKLFDGNTATVDKFNKKLEVTGVSANAACKGLGKLKSAYDMVEKAIKKSMSVVDEFTNTSSRLNLINDGTQTPVELQNKVFASAERSRSSYTNTASAISKMGLTAGEEFGNNDELIAFTELIQKGFKVGGASESVQSSGMTQLTRAMGSGKLQGDEFKSIMDNAPLIAYSIAEYTGKSKGELQELASEGLISSDIIKNAIFMASDDINVQFSTIPITFADICNKIKNDGLEVFVPVIEKVSQLINTTGFENFTNYLVVGFSLAAQAASLLIDAIYQIGTFFTNNWSMIEPVIWGVIAALLVYNATMGISWLTTLKDIAVKAAHTLASWAETAAIFALIVAQDGLNAALLACPITWIIISIIALIAIFYAAVAAVNHFAGTCISATGVIVGTFWGLYSFIYNIIATLVNTFISFSDFIGNLFINPVAAIKGLFFEMLITIMEYISSLATSLKELVNLIPGIEMDTASGFEGLIDNLKAKRDANITDNGLNGSSKWQNDTFGKMFDEGYKAGENFENNFSLDNLLGSLTGVGTENTFNIDDALDSLGTSNNPVTVEGTGSGGKVDVDMGDEDLQYLRDIAERDYINQFSTASLAPNIQFTFGDVHEEADANKVAGRIQKILAEEIAMVAEGVY